MSSKNEPEVRNYKHQIVFAGGFIDPRESKEAASRRIDRESAATQTRDIKNLKAMSSGNKTTRMSPASKAATAAKIRAARERLKKLK